MAGPTIAYSNIYAQGSILKTSSGIGGAELVYPYDYVFDRLNTKPWRSAHQTFAITANNCKLDFSITSGGGAALVATIPLGTYRGEELAGQIAHSLNQGAGVTDIFCYYNRTAKTFIIIKASGFLYLKWATGANKNNSIGPTLQYNTKADGNDQVTRTYTSEYDAISTGGNYIITSSNNKLYYNDGTSRTATIPTGTYNAKSLAAEIKYQMDNTSIATNFHANHYQQSLGAALTHRWRLERSSGTFQLTTSNTTNAIWATLGYTTGADKTGALGYTAEQRRIHTEEAIVIDIGFSTNITFVSVAGLNWAANETGGTSAITLESNSSDSWTSPTNHGAPTASFQDRPNKKGWAYWQINTSARYWRIKYINNDNPDGFVQIGALFGGTSTTLTTNYTLKTHTQRRQMFTEKQMTDQGAAYGTIKARLFEAEMEFERFVQADKNFVDGLTDSVADLNPFAILLDPTGYTTPKFVWATFVQVPEFRERAPHVSGSIWRCDNWQIREAG